MYRTRAEAITASKLLVKKMDTKGWRIQLLFNGGYFFRISKGGVVIHVTTAKTYYASCNDVERSAIAFKNPNAAVRRLIRDYRHHLSRQTKWIDKLEEKLLYVGEKVSHKT